VLHNNTNNGIELFLRSFSVTFYKGMPSHQSIKKDKASKMAVFSAPKIYLGQN